MTVSGKCFEEELIVWKLYSVEVRKLNGMDYRKNLKITIKGKKFRMKKQRILKKRKMATENISTRLQENSSQSWKKWSKKKTRN